MESKLIELATPFPDKYIRQKPGKANASYVNHGVIRQRLLDVVGFYDWSVDREIYQQDGKMDLIYINLRMPCYIKKGLSNGRNSKHVFKKS